MYFPIPLVASVMWVYFNLAPLTIFTFWYLTFSAARTVREFVGIAGAIHVVSCFDPVFRFRPWSDIKALKYICQQLFSVKKQSLIKKFLFLV